MRDQPGLGGADVLPDLEALVEAARLGLERGGERDVELNVRTVQRGLARFANSVVGQHAELADVEVSVRVARGSRVASASASTATADSIAEAIRAAAELAPHVPELQGFPGFAPGAPIAELPMLAEATARATPGARAELLRPIFDDAAAAGLTFAGTLATVVVQQVVATTAGQLARGRNGFASARLFARAAGGESGFGGAMTRDLAALDVRGLARRAIDRCRAAVAPRALPPGEYDVLLEPPAVAEWMEWMSFIGFGAREVAQGSSFLAGRAGEAITGEAISIADDPLAAASAGFAMPFDHEGTPCRRVTLIDRGRAGTPVYDRLHAARDGVQSTGHAADADGEVVPSARAIEVGTGTSTREALAKSVQRGLLVSRFHYVNGMLDPRRAAMTGMTRDGTYWMEDGVPIHAVKNLRFTDSVLEALGRTGGAAGIEDRNEPVPSWWSDLAAITAPAMVVRGLRFTGAADPT